MDLRIASPCPMKWEELRGDDRIRHCDRCRLNVYNLAEMDDGERDRFLAQAQGRVCGRLYVRPDGRAMLEECGAQLTRRWLRRLAVAAVLVASALAVPRFLNQLARGDHLPAPVVAFLEKMGIVETPRYEVGLIVIPPPRTPQAGP